MNVNNDLQGLQQVLSSPEVSKVQAGGKAASSATEPASRDEATLSSAGSLAAQSASDPDVRMDKVNQVQQALAAGTYNIPSSAVADRIIDQMLGK